MLARRGHSSLVGLIVTAVIAVPSFAYVMQNTLQSNPQHKMELTSASGAVSITNSREGQAILTAAPMLPGTSSTGLVSLANTGDGDETLSLDSGTPVDTPGPGGGHLSQRLQLRVEDVSTGNPVAVYEGTLSGLHGTDLGTLKKDEQRTYRFVVTFPDGGANGADNAYQGSSATIGFDWTAGAAGPSAPPADAPLAQQIAGDSPDAYWPLDASQAQMSDVVGNNTGRWANSVTTADGTVPGGGHAAYFNGVDGYGYVDQLAAPTQAYTLEAWVKPETADDMTILEHGGAGALSIRSGHFVFRHIDTTLAATSDVKVGAWQQVVGTWDASSGKARLYVDGALAAEADATQVPSGSSTFYIGRGNSTSGSSATRSSAEGAERSSSFFHGVMAQVAYFQSALAPDRVSAHWNSGKVDSSTGGTGGGSTGGGSTGGGSTGGTDGGTTGGGSTGDGGTSGTGGGIGTGVGQQTTCPGNVNAQGSASDERARRAARAKARARARAKALAQARARKIAKTRGKAKKRTATKRTAAKRTTTKKRTTCPGARAKTTKRASG